MKRIHILLVEDNEGDIVLMLEAFEESGINTDISVVREGKEAMEFLSREGAFESVDRPNLILLDINLPILNGMELLDWIKSDPELKKIPVIMLSTSSSQKDIDRAYGKHANCFVTKPIDMEDFLNAILKIEEFWLQLAKLAV